MIKDCSCQAYANKHVCLVTTVNLSPLNPLHFKKACACEFGPFMSTKMPPQSRGQSAGSERSITTFDLSAPVTPDESTPRALRALSHPFPSFDGAADVSTEEDDADFQSHYSLDGSPSSSSSSSGSPSPPLPNNASPLLHSSSSAHLLGANAFAPPFYNRPPTPLPPSPSLTSLLRPTFSATTSRPTTPDSSENDTPNDTEAVVAKSARTATTVSRVSPKVPTYEYYGFVLYLLSSGIFRTWPARSSSYARQPNLDRVRNPELIICQSCTYSGRTCLRRSCINSVSTTILTAGGLSPFLLSLLWQLCIFTSRLHCTIPNT